MKIRSPDLIEYSYVMEPLMNYSLWTNSGYTSRIDISFYGPTHSVLIYKHHERFNPELHWQVNLCLDFFHNRNAGS